MCWQKGTTTTSALDCTQVGWALDEHLYYYKILTASMAGKYTLSVKDSLGQTASTNVEYVGENSYYDFITENCTIAAGKNTCVSTFYLVNPASGKSYDVKNVTRNITTKNFFTPNSL